MREEETQMKYWDYLHQNSKEEQEDRLTDWAIPKAKAWDRQEWSFSTLEHRI